MAFIIQDAIARDCGVNLKLNPKVAFGGQRRSNATLRM
jgi:hypothetical protein